MFESKVKPCLHILIMMIQEWKKVLLKSWRGWGFGSNLKGQQFTLVPNVAPQATWKCFITAQHVGLAVFAFSDQIS